MTTDGEVKVGRVSQILHHQLCYAHGIQLAVLEVIYKQHSSVVYKESNQPETEEDFKL